jgi:hypothetical protein
MGDRSATVGGREKATGVALRQSPSVYYFKHTMGEIQRELRSMSIFFIILS